MRVTLSLSVFSLNLLSNLVCVVNSVTRLPRRLCLKLFNISNLLGCILSLIIVFGTCDAISSVCHNCDRLRNSFSRLSEKVDIEP